MDKIQIEFIDQYNSFFQDVINLGKKHSLTLGFMPDGGFLDHAQKRCVIIAHNKSELMGYLMFRAVTRHSRLSIVHLCIKEEFRRQNVSTKLLDALRQKYESIYSGISLSCRADYIQATELWKKYGFICKERKRSRSFDENYLQKWWYDFNKPDLFSCLIESSVKIKALLDSNIIMKLRDIDAIYEISQDPRPLLADWLIDEVDYYYAPELLNEIIRDEDKERINKTHKFLGNFLSARFDMERCKIISNQLKQIITGNTENDESDRKQLATCIVSNISYFITLDKGILEKRSNIENDFRIQIFAPHEFIIEIDQLINKEDYSPTRILGVTFHSIEKVTNLELNNLINNFLNKSNSEKKTSFTNIVYGEASNINFSDIQVVKLCQEAVAFFACRYEDKKLIIPFIRLLETEYKQTLFMQLISDFIKKAIDKNFSQISIKEFFLSDDQKSTLQRMGFEKILGEWEKILFNQIVESSSIVELDDKFYKSHIIKSLQKANKEEKTKIILEIERKLFPLKFLDLEIPCYIIPIKPYWAGQLFDYYISGSTLFGAEPNKIWNIENVYYRNIKPITEIAPARILWYVSTDISSIRKRAIVASSYLDEVMTDKPKVLFQKNKHYGIYTWEQIYDLCKHNVEIPIRALRFSGTEVFPYPISLLSIRRIFVENGKKENTFASPVKVNKNIFNQIYQKGKWNR